MGKGKPSVESILGTPKIRFKARLAVRPIATKGFLTKDQTYSLAKNMSEEANLGRRQGALKFLAYQSRKQRGDKRARTVNDKKRRTKAGKVRAKLYRELREIQNIARESAETAMRELVKIIESNTAHETSKIAAANVILDRAYGKATQINVNDNTNRTGKPNEVDGAELDSRIDQAIKRIEAVTRGKGQKKKSPPGPADVRIGSGDPGVPKQRLN